MSLKASPESENRIIERKPVQGDPNAVRVLFNSGDAITLSISDWVDLGLKVGQPVDPHWFDLLSERGVIHDAETVALSYLTGRVRTDAQVRAHLEHKGIPPDVVDSVVQRLTDLGVIDDERYAQLFVEQVGERTGRAQILVKLLRRGIDSQIAREAISQHLSFDVEFAAAQSAADKFVRRHGRPQTYPERMKMLQYLVRRGFTSSVASKAAEAACQAPSDESAIDE